MTVYAGPGSGPRTVLVTGAAGAGVTTAAGALGLVAARSGHKTLLLSVDGADRLGTAMGVSVADEPTELEAGLYGQPLGSAAWVDTAWQRVESAIRAGLSGLGLEPEVVAELVRSSLVDHVLRLGHLQTCLAEGRWDVIVADLGPTGAAFDLLGSAERARDVANRGLPVERRVERALRAGAAGADDPLLAALPHLSGQLDDLNGLLRGSNVTSYVVTSPDERGVELARDGVTALALLGHDVAGVLVNGLVPPGRGRWQAATAGAQRAWLADLTTRYGTAERQVRGLDHIPPPTAGRLTALVAAELADRMAGLDLLALRPPRGVRVSRTGEEFLLRLALPGVEADAVDLRRRGDDLLIAVGSRRRVLSLPSALRRCDIVGARLRAGDFVVTFRPDPKLWSETAW